MISLSLNEDSLHQCKSWQIFSHARLCHFHGCPCTKNSGKTTKSHSQETCPRNTLSCVNDLLEPQRRQPSPMQEPANILSRQDLPISWMPLNEKLWKDNKIAFARDWPMSRNALNTSSSLALEPVRLNGEITELQFLTKHPQEHQGKPCSFYA